MPDLSQRKSSSGCRMSVISRPKTKIGNSYGKSYEKHIHFFFFFIILSLYDHLLLVRRKVRLKLGRFLLLMGYFHWHILFKRIRAKCG